MARIAPEYRSFASGATTRSGQRRAGRLGGIVAAGTALLIAWTTVVRDDGNGLGFMMVILAAMVGSAAAWFRPAGMARAMAGVAAMQLLLGVGIATAPSTAAVPGGVTRIAVASGVFALLWLVAASCFRAAARASEAASRERPSPHPE